MPTASRTRVSPVSRPGSINAYADTDPDGVLSVAEFTAGRGRLRARPMPAATTASAVSTPGKYVVCEVLQAAWIQ